LGDGVSIPDIRMLEVRLVGVGKEAFYGGAFFENLLEFFGLPVECEPELVGIVEIDGSGASPFFVELGMVAWTGDGTFLALGLGVRTLVSSSVVSFGCVEPCGFGFHFLSTGSDDAAVGAEGVGFGIVSSGVDGDVSDISERCRLVRVGDRLSLRRRSDRCTRHRRRRLRKSVGRRFSCAVGRLSAGGVRSARRRCWRVWWFLRHRLRLRNADFFRLRWRISIPRSIGLSSCLWRGLFHAWV